MEKNKSFFSGIFWGGLVGSAIGLIVAPFSGKETRTKLSEINKIVDPALDAIDHGISKLDKAIEEGKFAMDLKRKELEGKEASNANQSDS